MSADPCSLINGTEQTVSLRVSNFQCTVSTTQICLMWGGYITTLTYTIVGYPR